MHFIIEHNHGHHKHVSTPLDPATASRNENVYSFWIKSVWGSYKNAWNIENRRLDLENKKILSVHNRMLQFSIIQLFYAFVLFFLAGFPTLFLLGLSGIFGFLLLETINYIEHYGLERKLLPSGRFEPVQPHHSWNADYPIGRILLYELTRHSDHHYKSTRKYQILRSIQEAPDLPTGYPGAMLLALIPPLWFRIVHPLLDNQKLPAEDGKDNS
jgi:alkane 1-monooxygenase